MCLQAAEYNVLGHVLEAHKVLRHVSILRDHLQGVYLYLAKVTGLFKNLRIFKFKI